MPVDIKKEFSLGTNPWGGHTPIGGTTSPYNNGLFGILSVIINNIFVIATIILFIFIIVGGLGMILNAGNAEKQQQGSKTITSALTGFLIVFASYWIIRIIEILTGFTILSL